MVWWSVILAFLFIVNVVMIEFLVSMTVMNMTVVLWFRMSVMIVMNILVDTVVELNFQMDMIVEWDFQMSVMNVMGISSILWLFSRSSDKSELVSHNCCSFLADIDCC